MTLSGQPGEKNRLSFFCRQAITGLFDEDQEKLKSLDGALADYERIAELRRRALARARVAEKALERERAAQQDPVEQALR